jgi:undecaprenyl-diphosphatase
MSILQSIILGIVQGLTEFLPISSSAHLVFVPYLLGWNIPATEAFVFDVLLQVATLLAVIVYFWKDLWEIIVAVLSGLWQRKPFGTTNARLGWLIVLATIPAGLAGLLLKSSVETAFASPTATAIFMFVTAGLLFAAERLGKRQRDMEGFTWKDALWIGLFQAISIFPGVSRSGSTISGGMMRNLKRPPAARFAFLMSVPIMLAAGLLASLDMFKIPNLASQMPVFIPGFITAALVGYLSIRWLLKYLMQHSLYVFSIYCALLGLLVLTLSLVGY